MSDIVKNLLVFAIVAALFGLGYYLFLAPDGMNLDTNATSPLDEQVLARAQEFIQHRSVLEQIDLSVNMEIFTDPKFTSLQSFETPVPDQPLGKDSLFDGGMPEGTTAAQN